MLLTLPFISFHNYLQIRWVVESANSRIKRYKYLDKVLPTSQVPFIGEFVRIVCAISNKYFPPLTGSTSSEEDEALADHMKELSIEVGAFIYIYRLRIV